MKISNLKEFFQSKKFTKTLCGVGIAIIVLFVFQAGVFVGYKKASFSHRGGDNYFRAFGERKHKGAFYKGALQKDFSGAHGAIGKIINLDFPSFVIESSDNTEKIALISDKTVVRRFRETINPSDLNIDDFVVVIGSPDDQGRIEARLIRLMPSPPDFEKTSSNQ